MKGLSIIIPSFNTKKITKQCITALNGVLLNNKIPYQIIVVDNSSTDGSQIMLQEVKNPRLFTVFNSENKGYGKANNQGLKIASMDYVLFLNSDVLVDKQMDFSKLIHFFETHEKIGGLTVKVNLINGSIDPASHRGFPTPWRSLCYFIGFERLFSKIPIVNRLFGGYHLVFLDKKSTHEIDSPTGAFFMVSRSLLQELHGFDEDFFMYGEDLDLSFRIKEKGYKIIYLPTFQVLHYKYQSGLQNKKNQELRKKIRKSFYEAMATFYKKHYEKVYPRLVTGLVYLALDLRITVLSVLGK